MQSALNTLRLSKLLTRLRALACLLILNAIAASSWAQQPTQYDRTQFGDGSYPIWSPLSFFERQTLSERFDAQTGDPDALLALYILASGRYEQRDFEHIKKAVDQFITTLRDSTDKLLDPWQQGELLNGAMHHHFFGSSHPVKKDDDEPPLANKYDADQSALAPIFSSQQFNCISSSMLYAVLARKLDFDGKGVMLPSHAFIELYFDEKIAEVETTSPKGFDQHHDEAFYERAKEWFTPRGIAPSTYQDYLKRQRVPFWQLATRNMLHQHTHPHRMNDIDRGRLAEISAFLDPDYEPAQQNRLHYLTNEASQLAEAHQWTDVQRLLDRVLPTVLVDAAKFPNNDGLQHNIFWLHLVAIDTAANLGQSDAFTDAIAAAFELSTNAEREQQIKARAIDGSKRLLTKLAEREQFEQGPSLLAAIEPYVFSEPAFFQNAQWFYNVWARSYWESKAWPDVIATIEDYLAGPYLAADISSSQQNLASAYFNWVLTEMKANRLDSASAIALQCTALHAAATCQKATQVILKQAAGDSLLHTLFE